MLHVFVKAPWYHYKACTPADTVAVQLVSRNGLNYPLRGIFHFGLNESNYQITDLTEPVFMICHLCYRGHSELRKGRYNITSSRRVHACGPTYKTRLSSKRVVWEGWLQGARVRRLSTPLVFM